MKSILIRSILLFLPVFLIISSISQANAEQRTALVIGNGSYSSSPLKNPVSDATDLATNLRQLNFSVTLKKDVNHQEMEEAIREFGEQLKKGGVGLFFYAGHGVQVGGRNYLLPVGVRINKETDVKFQAVDAEMVLAEMSNAGNDLNILILDACRDNPFGRKFRSVNRGLAIISDAPKGTFITYSTSPGTVAADGAGRNSPYTESLLLHMTRPGLPIEEVFKRVRRDISKKTQGQQVPWELSSLEGQFFFAPARPVISGLKSAETMNGINYEAEQKKIAAERESLRKERELYEQRKALIEEKQRRMEEAERIKALDEEVYQQKILESEKVKLKKEKDLLEKKKALAQEKKLLEEEQERLEMEQQAASAKKAVRDKNTSKGAIPQESPPLQQALYKNNIGSINDSKEKLLFRSKPRSNLSAGEFSELVKKYNVYDSKYNKSGSFKNIFSDMGDGTIVDNATGLMWQKGGSNYGYSWNQISGYLADLNNKRFAGHSDWRLPTIEELATLLKKKTQGSTLFIDPSFSDRQYSCWSSDLENETLGAVYSNQVGADLWVWFASFDVGSAMVAGTSKLGGGGYNPFGGTMKPQDFYIRAVRSIKY